MSADIDLQKIQEEVKNGYIYAQRHPSADLTIYNYSPKAQWEKHWTTEVMQCRGLIVHDSGKIIARPFQKFFNYEEVIDKIPNEPFEAFEKMDGSLGILYWVGNEPTIATRGSFTSDQARYATNLLREKYKDTDIPNNITLLYEILYPENQIVVDYGERAELILLAAIAGGYELPWSDLGQFGFPVVKRFDDLTDLKSIREFNQTNFEGFVLRFQSGFRCKVKLTEYVRLHKILTGLTPRHVWEELSSGRGIDDFIERVPDEFMKWLRDVEAKLKSDFNEINVECERVFRDDFPDRKSAAEYIKKQKYPGILFKMLDKRDPVDMIWKMIYPPAANAFRCGE